MFFFSFPGTFDLITIYVSSIHNSQICQFVDWERFGMSYYNWFCYLFWTQAWTGLDFCSVWVVVPTQTGGGIRPPVGAKLAQTPVGARVNISLHVRHIERMDSKLQLQSQRFWQSSISVDGIGIAITIIMVVSINMV